MENARIGPNKLEQHREGENLRLVLLKKNGGPEIYPLDALPLTIGREPTNAIVLKDNSVSRMHARIDLAEGKVVIADLGSSNGIFVNGAKVTTFDLTDGDALEIGNFMFSVEKDEAADAAPAADLTTHTMSPDEIAAATQDPVRTTPASSVADVLGFFHQAGRILESAFVLDDILRGILDLSFQMIPAERGFILLVNSESGEMDVRAQKFREGDAGGLKTEAKLSTTILDTAVKQGRAVLTTDAAHDDRFGGSHSIVSQQIRGAVCVPLKGREETLGAIYVDSRISSHQFSMDDLKLLASVGAQLGIAVENARLYESKLNAERLAAVGQAVAGLGHCIKNILNGMEGGSFILEKGLDKDDQNAIRKGWDILKRNSSRLKDLVLDMLAYSKPREPVYEKTEGNLVPAEVVEFLGERAAAQGVKLAFEPDGTLGEVMIDSKAIYRVLLNLVTNAVDACPAQEGRVTVRTVLPAGGKRYQIIVEDNGSGIGPEDLAKLGRAFFSTKGAQGTGLGLSVSYKIVQEHKGSVSVASRVGEGTSFTVTLPLSGPESG